MRTQYLPELPPHWQPVADIFAALGDETRQKILLLFEPGDELSIKDIASQFSFGRTTVVHHLTVLEKAGILGVRRCGRLALYSLRHAPVLDALEKLRMLIDEDLTAAPSERTKVAPDPLLSPGAVPVTAAEPAPAPKSPDLAATQAAKTPTGTEDSAGKPAFDRDSFFLSNYL